ncbi:MAG: LPS-assembly protein LptD, partial [Terriglobales bacterium]
EWRLDYDSHSHDVAASAFSGNFHFGKGFFSGSHYLLRPPAGLAPLQAPPRFDQVRLAAGYGNAAAPGYSMAAAVAYDAITGKLQYTTLQASHNWDCCGFSLEYRRFALASVRRENQFLVSFTLANVATFGNLKRQDRLF